MPQYSFKDKAIDSYDLQKSSLLKPFELDAQIKNFGVNLQQKYSRERRTILLGNTAKYRQMWEILDYLRERARYCISVKKLERSLLYT